MADTIKDLIIEKGIEHILAAHYENGLYEAQLKEVLLKEIQKGSDAHNN